MLLAIDTSTSLAGLAVYGPSGPVTSACWECGRRQTVELLPALDWLLGTAKIGRGDLEAIAVATGPGSFSSVRVGMATAKGLAVALGVPLVGVHTLCYTAWPHRHLGMPVRACASLGRRRVAVGAYTPVESGSLREEWVRNLAPSEVREAGPLLYCGEMSSDLREALAETPGVVVLPPAESRRDPAVLAELAWNRLLRGDVDSYSLQAEYLDPR